MNIENRQVNLYEIYHERSKMNGITQTEMGLQVTLFFRNPFLSAAVHESYKVYPYLKRFPLSRPPLEADFADVLTRRRSARSFVRHDLTVEELSGLCYYSYGITDRITSLINGVEHRQDVRSAPSAGAIYPIDFYLVIFSGSDIPPGVYHYNVIEHSLELLREGDFRGAANGLLSGQFSLDTASCVIALSAHFSKSTVKYGERGYRFVLLDAGHLMQNVYLSATALGLGCYACGGFCDDDFSEFLGLDGLEETVVYCAVVGKSK